MDKNQEIYCRKLGHHVPLAYCLAPGQDVFCSSFRDCWFARMDVDGFLEENYTLQQREEALKPSTPKVTGIMAVLERLGALAQPE